MLRYLILLALLAAAPLAGKAGAEGAARHLPELSGYFLAGEKVSIPSDLTEPATLLVVTQEGLESEGFESWRRAANALEDDVGAIFVLLLGERGRMDRTVSAGRLRRQVPDADFRAALVPVFQDGGEFYAGLGPGAADSVTALLVRPDGEILWQTGGRAGPETADEIRAQLRRAASPARDPIASLPDMPPAQVPDPAPPREIPAAAPVIASVDVQPPRAPAAPDLFEIRGVTLAGQQRLLPGDLGEGGTRLALLTDDEGGDLLRSVLEEMQAAAGEDGQDWLVLVFKGRSTGFGKAFASGKLRGEVPSVAARGHVLPVYMERPVFERLLGLAPVQGVRVITMDRAGDILNSRCLGQAC